MFKNRLISSFKKLLEPIIWIGITLIIMYGIYNYKWIGIALAWTLIPLVIIGGLFIGGSMIGHWVSWQFIEPYKIWKNNNNK